MNGLYPVITDSTCKGGGARGTVQGIDASRNVSRGGQTPGGPQKICERGSPKFLCRLKNMLKYAHRGGGGSVVLMPTEFFPGAPKSIKVDLQNL